MNKIIEKYLKSVQDENGVSSAAGLGFKVDDPYGFVRKASPSEKNKKKKKEIIMDEQVNNVHHHRVLIDLDGVIHDYINGWNNGKLGDVINNTKESIDDIRNTFNNVKIIIFTTRASYKGNDNTEEQIKNVKNFLEKNNIYYDNITGEKLGALIYIDDNGWRFSGNWKKDLPQIKEIIGKRIEEAKV